MKPIPCDRCGTMALIPTHQGIKFDGEMEYLCEGCWQEFRRWFNTGRKCWPDMTR